MDYIAICKAFYAATGIPVVLMRCRKTGDFEYGEAIGEVLFSSLEYVTAIPAKKAWTVFYDLRNPVFCRLTPDIEYGFLRIEGTELAIAVGPMFSIPVTDELIQKYILDAETPIQYREQIGEILNSIPVVSHSRYAWLLAFLNMVINRQGFDVEMVYDVTGLQPETMLRRAVEDRQKRLETETLHTSYRAEQQLYAVIREGDLSRLDKFLSVTVGSYKEGRMASSPLRHAKNIFITSIARLVFLSAIPGGMDAEQAQQLMDVYIQECEQLSTIEAVQMLQYSMVRDFTIRIGKAKLPEGISVEVHAAAEFIRCHINTSITVADVAAHVGRSASHMIHRFKDEMNCTIGEYISQCRLEEAASLLRHSDKSLADISSYLCFSSQPYFQNVFKKKYGVTPMQYRKRSIK